MNTLQTSIAKSSSIPAVQPEAAHEHPTHVLVPIDFSPESVAALRAAACAAEKSHAHLTLLNVVECGTIYRGTEVPGSHRKLQESHGRRLEELAESVIPSTISADIIVGGGDPENEINRVAAQRHVDYIVLGQHQHRHWFGGDTAQKVSETAPCKVIMWRHNDAEIAFEA